MASDPKFTPGPWVTCDAHGPVEEGTSIQSSLDTNMVASCCHYYSREQVRANARLIAAAPDLYAVVEELEESSSYWSEYCVPLGIVYRLRAALAKARGEA